MSRRGFLQRAGKVAVGAALSAALPACASGVAGKEASPQGLTEDAKKAITDIPSTATETPTKTAEPTATATEAPTQTAEPTATATATEVPIDSLIPQEWLDRIDRTEVLADGRIVAIAKAAEEGDEAKLRVLQYDQDKKEWVKYKPVMKYVYTAQRNEDTSIFLDELSKIPHPEYVKPLIDVNGVEIPMGSLATVAGPQGEWPARLISAVFAGVVPKEIKVAGDQAADYVLYDITTETGDVLRLVMQIFDSEIFPSQGGYYLANKIDIGKIIEESQSQGFSFVGNCLEEDIDATAATQYNYLHTNADQLAGTQIVLVWKEEVKYRDSKGDHKVDQRWFIDMVEGKTEVADRRDFPGIVSAFLIPESMRGVGVGK